MILHSRLVFKYENQSAIFMPGYLKTDSKYLITGRKGVEIYAIYRTGSRAGSKADGFVDVPEELRAF